MVCFVVHTAVPSRPISTNHDASWLHNFCVTFTLTTLVIFSLLQQFIATRCYQIGLYYSCVFISLFLPIFSDCSEKSCKMQMETNRM